MATAVSPPTATQPPILDARQGKPQLIVNPQLTQRLPVAIKVGVFGPQGAGKSTTAALIAAAISAQHCNRAPIGVVDPEDAWGFLERRIFSVEGIPLIRRPYRSFDSMHNSIKEFEREGCCCWIADPITLHWNELMEVYKGKKGFVAIDQWGDIRAVWNEYVADFLNSKMTCIAAGRLGNDFEDREEEDSKGNLRTKTVKVGTKFKAGGGESFGYEPHLLFEMSLERKAKKVRGQEREGEGRMVHRADVLKDRTWTLNGLVLRWSDKSRYERGGYGAVWGSIRPHFVEVQAAKQQGVGSDTSQSLIVNDSGNSEYWERKQRKDVLSGELHCTMDSLWGGTAQAAKQMRMRVFEHIFGFKSKEAADAAPLEKIERGVRILQAFEQRVAREKGLNNDLLAKSDLDILAQLDIDIREHDEGVAVEEELPF